MDNCTDVNNTVTKLKVGVHKKFSEIRAALQMREKLLLRQLEVVASMNESGAESNIASMSHLKENDIKILFENEEDVLGAIRTFGRFQLGSMLFALKQEDYITPSCDHETMYKNIQCDDNQADFLPQHTNISKSVMVDFSKDKSLIEDNTKYINNSIVNITLAEAKELIRSARIQNETFMPPLNLEELDDELESSIVEAVSNLNRNPNSNDQNLPDMQEKEACKKTKNARSKQKVTINNCSGTINLRNISSVTINCLNDKCDHDEGLKMHTNKTNSSNSTTTIDAMIPSVVGGESHGSTPNSAESFSNQSSNSSSRSQSKKLKDVTSVKKPTEINKFPTSNLHVPNVQSSTETNTSREITCDFYNRLLNEIKRNLDEQKPSYDTAKYKKSNKITSKQAKEKEPQLVLKNFENLNIVLKNDADDENIHPVHIEHWLSEIIKDTDLEPMQNTDILEHSKINE